MKLAELCTEPSNLYLWDNMSMMKWHNMSQDNKASWLIVMDMFRDKPSKYTEEILSAIENGLCPQKIIYAHPLTKTNIKNRFYIRPLGQINKGWESRSKWGFRIGQMISSTNVKRFSQMEPNFYLIEGFGSAPAYAPLPGMISAEEHLSMPYGARRFRKPIYAFNELRFAWRFLFSMAEGKE